MTVQPTPELIKALQAIAEELFEETKPERTTIRVLTPNDPDYPVLGEARAPGVSSLTGGMSLQGYKPFDIHATSTMLYLKNERKMILQRDVRVDEPVIPELAEFSGTQAQMLLPIEHEGDFVGVVSVHSAEPRNWAEKDIAAIKKATERVERVLDESIWV